MGFCATDQWRNRPGCISINNIVGDRQVAISSLTESSDLVRLFSSVVSSGNTEP